ncbi:stabilizer of axonemal microtubules 1 [Pelodiscus sinensis]|uniref:Stabilizer of axonemal microtubules 1 n=1 Tax=Pelodiscus sinensis TaxID=13735 RepID=K7FSL4_PELSI|nr:stabilizer of axonemal microtubules 1 [Pelodiscus sinensis]|eukprot:XP_006130051.1 stabilizer of axonemal microtubules 1 [Pelodiscus sinensis]
MSPPVTPPKALPTKKCICQLCSCGRHHCPHLPTRIYEKSEKPCFLSEYVDQYPLYPYAHPRDSFKPKADYQRQAVAVEGMTTFKRDYVPHEVLPVKFKAPEKYVKSDENMDLISTYKQDYNPYSVGRVPPCLPRETNYSSNVKMDTIPTYKGDYVQWNEPKREMIKPDNKYHPAEAKFDYRTTVQDDYVYKGPVTTHSCKPLNPAHVTKVPLEDLTNYKLNYVPHPLEKRFVHEYEKYKPSEGPFDGLTTHKQSYKGLAGPPAKIVKPYQAMPTHDLPFSSSTEFREKYQAWPQPPTFIRKPDVYVPPVEKMDLQTTTQTHYTYPKGQPAKSCRPLGHVQKATAPFDSCSTMKDDYKPWHGKKAMPIIHPPEITLPAEPMENLTTFRAHYVPHPPIFTKSFKPGWSAVRPNIPVDAETTYTTSYTPKETVRCLASYKEPPGYVLQEIDASGHKFYCPISEAERPLSSKSKERSSRLSGNGLTLPGPKELAVLA